MKFNKIFILLPLILFVSLALFSCNKENGDDEIVPKTESPYLKITGGTSTRSLSYDGGTINVWIDSNTEWVCSVSGASELKLKTDKTKGHGNDVIVVSYASTRNIRIHEKLTGLLTIQWVDKYKSKRYQSISFVRNATPSW